jgi:hypothetical protein
MSKVMLKMIPLVLERIEGFILDFPTRPTTAHDLKDIGRGHGKVGDSTEVLCLGFFDFPIFYEIDQQLRIRFIQGGLIEEPKAMQRPFDFAFEFGQIGMYGRLL